MGTEPGPLWLEASSLTASSVFNLKLHNFSAELLAGYRNFESYQILLRAKTEIVKTLLKRFQISSSGNLFISLVICIFLD